MSLVMLDEEILKPLEYWVVLFIDSATLSSELSVGFEVYGLFVLPIGFYSCTKLDLFCKIGKNVLVFWLIKTPLTLLMCGSTFFFACKFV